MLFDPYDLVGDGSVVAYQCGGWSKASVVADVLALARQLRAGTQILLHFPSHAMYEYARDIAILATEQQINCTLHLAANCAYDLT